MEQYVSTAAVAERLGIAPVTLRVWRHRGEGPPAYKVGTQVRYRAAEVEAWVQAHAISRTDPVGAA